MLLALAVLFSFSTNLTAAESETAIEETPIDDFDRDHWAYRPIESPAIPSVTDNEWPQTTIDHFILAALEKKSLAPAPPADRETLIRRVSFDLTGLPPTIDQLDAFENDRRPGAYRRMVDRMLASPQYGRRWGQYWLDLARFAETDGFEHDNIRPTAWRYRDWVINALNADMPYNKFLMLQLAGDAWEQNDPDSAIATAFCLSGPDMPDINSQEERKHVLMNEVTSTIGAVVLSLQMGCAQCHDHKYDAISQGDFYRLRAFFDPAVKVSRNKSVTTLHPQADPSVVSRLMIRGDWRSPGPEVTAAFPRIANRDNRKVKRLNHGQQRLDLAIWLTDPSHPLTSRSVVNRVWQFHFGRGLSSTPSDFGVMGAEPSHPELLDHLASQLIDRRWSLKELHRQILLSSVYQTSSRPAGAGKPAWQAMIDTDPENELLARFPRRRLDAEAIRDAMLAASGALNHEIEGPGVSPPLPEELIKTLKNGQWKTSKREGDHYRRSIYIFARRNLLYPMFATFDRPAANCSCAVRHPSTTPVQSLLLLNSKITLDAAQRLAARVAASHGDPKSQTIEIYRRVLAREPEPIELEEGRQFLSAQIKMLRAEGKQQPQRTALTDLCRALFNSNSFLYID